MVVAALLRSSRGRDDAPEASFPRVFLLTFVYSFVRSFALREVTVANAERGPNRIGRTTLVGVGRAKIESVVSEPNSAKLTAPRWELLNDVMANTSPVHAVHTLRPLADACVRPPGRLVLNRPSFSSSFYALAQSFCEMSK